MVLPNDSKKRIDMSVSQDFVSGLRAKPHNAPARGTGGAPMGEVRAVTDVEFETTVNEDGWVLVDFWARLMLLWSSPFPKRLPIFARGF